MPDNLDEPSHALMRRVAEDARWRQRLASASAAREPILSARGYAEALLPQCRSVEVWRTVYHHPLPGAAAIVEFVSATGLRPYLEPLSAEEQAAFKSAYQAELHAAYPPLADGSVLLAFPRIFIVAGM
jgi:trans-aconitate 2-methyltransferase